MWTWDCSVQGRSAAGACHDKQRAMRAAEAWMREHWAAEAGRQRNNRITWRPAS
jgi:hypothetical protein